MKMRCLLVTGLAIVFLSHSLSGQVPGPTTSQPTRWSMPAAPVARPPASAPAADDQVQLIFPGNIEVRTLVDYVSKRLNLNIMFQDQALGTGRITLTSPTRIPKESLLGFLQTVLKMSGLALVDSEQPGWKKIVPSVDAGAMSPGLQQDTQRLLTAEGGEILTQVFQLQNTSTQMTEQAIRPFLSKAGGSGLSIADRNIIIVTDYVTNLRKIADLIQILDTPRPHTSMRFVQIKYGSAVDLSKQALRLLEEKDKMASPGKNLPRNLNLVAEARTNQVVVISSDGSEQEALDLISLLDVPEAEPAASNVRFYKLTNATASNVLATIRALEGGGKGFAQMPEQPGSVTPVAPQAAISTINIPGEKFQGPNLPPAAPGSMDIPTPPYFRESTSQPAGAATAAPALAATTAMQLSANGGGKGKDDIQVTADPNTNTIIVIAPAAVQTMYKQLITELDKRRPQVMVEVTLVALDTTNDLSLGVEMAKRNTSDNGENSALVFSSFGLSQIDPVTGQMAITPGAGFNGVLLAPDAINVVIKALSAESRAKIISAPKVLVNDNATASLSSVAESPYTSVNATNTSQSTSFAGYASAGTTITLTPHISEGEHLALQYTVTLNSFTGSGSQGIPPPRNTNQINSEVTVPDGYAIVVGGLTRVTDTYTDDKLPILGSIPILKYAFGNYRTTKEKQTLFAFIRPVILRDDQFADLKFLSDRDLALAKQPPNEPTSEPQVMK